MFQVQVGVSLLLLLIHLLRVQRAPSQRNSCSATALLAGICILLTCTYVYTHALICIHIHVHAYLRREGRVRDCPSRSEFGNWTTTVIKKISGGSGTARRRRTRQMVNDDPCQYCGSTDDGGDDVSRDILLCDSCGCGWHMYCLPLPLAVVPQGDWYCPDCSWNPRESLDLDNFPDIGWNFDESEENAK